MVSAEKTLTILLRVSAILLLFALVPVFIPHAWMDKIHRELGLGTMPTGPLVEYLTRSISMLYAMHGTIVLYASLDVRRHRGLIRLLATVGLVFGVGMTVLDCTAGLPLHWIIGEGPMLLVFNSVLLWLTTRIA